MEENVELFSLTIDPLTKHNLAETAKWARFLAIVGFVVLGLMVVSGVLFALTLTRSDMVGNQPGLMAAASGSIVVFYLLLAAIAFFPLLFTFRFASQMKTALANNDQALFNAAFQNLKVCLRYLGIVTIISLVLMVLSLIFGVAGLALN